MKTDYKVTVTHLPVDNPDKYVDAAEIVVNKALEIGMGNRSGGEAWLLISDKLHAVGVALQTVDNKLTANNPQEITKEEIVAYINSLVELSAVALCTLTSIMYNIEEDKK